MRRDRLFKLLNWKTCLASVLLLGAAVNVIAWKQAYAMTHYLTGDVVKTAKPEQLSFSDKLWVGLTGVQVPRPINEQTPESLGMMYETHQIAFARNQASGQVSHRASDPASDETRGEHLEAWMIPADSSKGIVLMFPQYGSSKQAILAPAKAFHELGYDTLLVDFRGAGGSSGSDTTMGVREGVDVAEAMRYAAETWPEERPVILYGASMGAASVMRAVAHEGVTTPDAMILESPFDQLLVTVRHRFTASGLPTFPGAELMVFWGGFQQDIDGFAHNPVAYAEAIACPVLLMHGEADTRVRTADAEAIFAQLPGPKELVLFPTVGHGAFVSDDPDKWRQTIAQFLQTSLLTAEVADVEAVEAF